MAIDQIRKLFTADAQYLGRLSNAQSQGLHAVMPDGKPRVWWIFHQTVTDQKPARSPFNGCNPKPGKSILETLGASSRRARIRSNLSAWFTSPTVSIATFRAPDGFACKAKCRRHSDSTSRYFNAAGGFVRSPRRACLSAPVDCVVGAQRRLGYALRANALPRTLRDKLNVAILAVGLVTAPSAGLLARIRV